MTYGFFLNELLYSTIFHKFEYFILDEFHERSTEIDFVFGVLLIEMAANINLNKKLILMSATFPELNLFSDWKKFEFKHENDVLF